MAGPNEIQKQSKQHVFDTRQVSKPDLDLYDDLNKDAFAEMLVEKYVGKKWVKETTSRNKYEVSHELTFQAKVDKYDMSKDGQLTAESYIQDIEAQHIANNHIAYKRRRSAGKAKNYYRTCNEKAAKLNDLRQRIEQNIPEDKLVKLKREEYDLEMSLLDSRLAAMTESAKAKSIGDDDEKIRILKAKLAILLCKEKLSTDRYYDEREERVSNKYKRLSDDYANQIRALKEQLENSMRDKYGEVPSTRKKKKLLTGKEKQIKEHAEYMASISDEESAYVFTRLYETGQVTVNTRYNDAAPTQALLEENFEKFAYGAGFKQLYSGSKLRIKDYAATPEGRAEIERYRRDHIEILTSIDHITGEQAMFAIKKMVADNCLPNCLNPILNVMCLDTNNETFRDTRFVNYCVKPLLKAVTTSKATGIIRNAGNITAEQVRDVHLRPRKVTYVQPAGKGEMEALDQDAPTNLYMAIRDAQQFAADKFEMSLGMEEDRIYRHLPSNELNVPLQGSKIHVGFATRYEFLEYVPILAEEFIRLGIRFKLLSGNALIEQTEDERNLAFNGEMTERTTAECGKEITIYPTHSFDPEALSEKAREILYQRSDYHPASDSESEIRMSVRYGGFLGENLMNDGGAYEKDIRGQDHDVREKTVDETVKYFKDLKADYAKGELTKKQLIQAYCLGTRTATEDLFDIYVFDEQKKMKDCMKKIPRNLRHKTIGAVRLNIFGAYMIAVPKALQKAGAANSLSGFKGDLIDKNMDLLNNEPW